jgi:hypothetical protein
VKLDKKLLRLLKRGGYKSTPCPQVAVPKAGRDHEPSFHYTCSGCGSHRGTFHAPHEGRTPSMYCQVCGTTRDLVKGEEV